MESTWQNKRWIPTVELVEGGRDSSWETALNQNYHTYANIRPNGRKKWQGPGTKDRNEGHDPFMGVSRK